jgi:hypothetical protein
MADPIQNVPPEINSISVIALYSRDFSDGVLAKFFTMAVLPLTGEFDVNCSQPLLGFARKLAASNPDFASDEVDGFRPNRLFGARSGVPCARQHGGSGFNLSKISRGCSPTHSIGFQD